jgi:hypothetical protein
MSKKITIIIGVVLIIFLFILGYAFLSKPNTTNTTEQTTGTNFFSNIFPFLKSTSNLTNSILDLLKPSEEKVAPQETSLIKVSSFPIAGFGVFNKERFVEVPEVSPAIIAPTTETTNTSSTTTNKIPEIKPTPPPTEFIPTIKYVEKATGNIYQTYADKIDERKLSSNILPTIYESFFGFNKDSESVIMRYLQENNIIETFVRTLPKQILGGDIVEDNSTPGSFLPENITDLSISPDASQIFFLFNVQNSSVGITASSTGDKKTQIFVSPFTEWLSQWPNDRMITLTTKPSYNVPGYMYAIDPTKKDFNKILGGINGLTTLTSPSGKMVLYSGNNLSIYLYDTTTKNSKFIGLNTLPEKCVWDKTSTSIYCAVPKDIPAGQYPDSWYMGEISFSDDIWKIDIASGNTILVADPTNVQGGEEIDGIKLAVDENQKYLFFVNKKDSYLWEFSL